MTAVWWFVGGWAVGVMAGVVGMLALIRWVERGAFRR